MEALWNKKVRAEECPGGGGKVGWYAPECDVEERWFSRKSVDLFLALSLCGWEVFRDCYSSFEIGFFFGSGGGGNEGLPK